MAVTACVDPAGVFEPGHEPTCGRPANPGHPGLAGGEASAVSELPPRDEVQFRKRSLVAPRPKPAAKDYPLYGSCSSSPSMVRDGATDHDILE